jgi:tripartite-type tricarboxylate transporter receptor subunit TctC
VFETGANSGVQTLGDVLKAARDKPGTINLGSIVVGSTQNLTAELFKSMSGADVVIVPFRTSPDEAVALLRGDVQMAVEFYAAAKPGLQSGQARALATSGPKRSPELPDVPTVAEAGVPNFDVTSWNALYAPVGTPPDIVDKLNRTLQDVLADPDVKKRALDLGIDAKASTPAEIDARMRADIAKWGKVIESANIPKQ